MNDIDWWKKYVFDTGIDYIPPEKRRKSLRIRWSRYESDWKKEEKKVIINKQVWSSRIEGKCFYNMAKMPLHHFKSISNVENWLIQRFGYGKYAIFGFEKGKQGRTFTKKYRIEDNLGKDLNQRMFEGAI